MALFDQPAFKNVIVNGILLAEDGNKMSKRPLHENGHIIYHNHTTNQNSIMASPGGTHYYTNLDLKGPFISYEKTFLSTVVYGIENLDFILGNNFYK